MSPELPRVAKCWHIQAGHGSHCTPSFVAVRFFFFQKRSRGAFASALSQEFLESRIAVRWELWWGVHTGSHPKLPTAPPDVAQLEC